MDQRQYLCQLSSYHPQSSDTDLIFVRVELQECKLIIKEKINKKRSDCTCIKMTSVPARNQLPDFLHFFDALMI